MSYDRTRIYSDGPKPSRPTAPTVTFTPGHYYTIETMCDPLRRGIGMSDFERWLIDCGYDSGTLTPFRTGAQAFVEYLRRSQES
jgi:hypothetical protein